jgi:hypothetical protein
MFYFNALYYHVLLLNLYNVKDSTLKLALKHPAQTTIVQMQKDGTYRVVYGTDLDKIR